MADHQWYQTEDGERIWLAKSDYTYRQALHEAAGPARDVMGDDSSYYYRFVGLVDATLTEHEAGCDCAVDLPEDDPDSGMTCRTEVTQPAYKFELTERYRMRR
jgi:hypothetical protein